MTILFRTNGPWGAGLGGNLTPAQVDANFWDIAGRLVELETNPPEANSIESITVLGTQMTIHLTDGTPLGPFTLPVAVFQPRGTWVDDEDYETLDLVSVATLGTYMVLQDHNSNAPFDPNRTISGQPVYHLLFPPGAPGPAGPEGPAGDDGEDGAPGADGIFFIGGAGPLVSRDAFDDAEKGFIYLSVDGDGVSFTKAVIFIHGDGGTGDWTGPYEWEGDAGTSFEANAVGDFSERATYNSQAEGFSFLSLDGDGPGGDYTTPVVFFKLSGTSGDWSDPVLFTGPAGASFDPDAIGVFADRDDHDAEVEGFSYLSTDGDAGATTVLAVIFIKNSGTPADWSDPIPFQGPEGPDGPAGPTGPAGSNFDPDEFGLFVDRATWDGQATGFSFLSLDGDGVDIATAVIFIKLSGGSGDWSDPIGFQGPQGEQGEIGPTGAVGPIGLTGPSGTNFNPDAIGVFADRAAYNSQPEDFSFLSTNGDGGANLAASIYIKNSNTSGDWSARIPFRGPKGDTGNIGPAGPIGNPGATGASGSNGVGVPTGGSTGQVLAKTSNANFATAWVNPGSGDYHDSVRASSVSAFAMNGELTHDTVVLVADDSFLMRHAADPGDNGWYIVVAGGPWTRRVTENTSAEVTSGALTVVEEGSAANAGKIFVLTTPDPIVLGTTDLVFAEASPAESAMKFTVPKTITGAASTLAASDVGKWIRRSHATAATVTIPPNSTVPIANGAEVFVQWWGVGAVSFVAGAGVTLRAPYGLDLPARYVSARLKKVSADVWSVEFSPIPPVLPTTMPVEIMVALSDETTDITTGVAKLTMRMPYAMALTAVRASLADASSSGLVTVDINESGSTILSTKLTIDATEKTSLTATPAVISDAALADDAEITFDIDAAGTDAKGLKVTLIGTRTI